MTRAVLATSVAFIALIVPAFGAPDGKPDLSGTWELSSTRTDSPHSGTSSGPVSVVIKQTPTEISVETRRDGQSETIVYQLDGSETEKPAPDNGPYKWKAQWDGAKLNTQVHRNINRATVTITEALSLGEGGKELIVDRTLTVQHGYDLRGARNYASAKDVFVKAQAR